MVEQVHREYVEAGCEVLEANTFGGNRKRLEAAGLEKRFDELNQAGAALALRASQGKALVAGSIGPLGALIEPYGDVSIPEALDIFADQVRLLRGCGIELFLVETMISLEEALIALEAAQLAGARSVAVTLTFESTPAGPRTPFGESPAECAMALIRKGAVIVGANCGSGIDILVEAGNDFLAVMAPEKILLQPNAGIPVITGGTARYPETEDRFARFVIEAANKGIRYLGGCCGTTPSHLSAAKRELQKLCDTVS